MLLNFIKNQKMRTPTTVKGYLKLLIQIADDSAYDLKNVTEEEVKAIGFARANIQNDLGDEDTLAPLLRKYKLKRWG